MPTAIVTGASRGLGRAVAEALAERGWRLVIDARGAEALDAVRAALAPRADVVALAGDVNDPRHRAALVDACGGELAALVNNAGILGPSPLPAVAEVAPRALEELLLVNTVAPLALLQRALPLLSGGSSGGSGGSGGGRVVNVTSDAAVEPYPGWGPYGAAKAALEHLTRVLAAEREDVRAYAFDPGDMRTRMHQDAFPGEDISDRPEPARSVPALLRLLEGDLPSGRYTAAELS